jgi:hypothetical protein
MASQSLLNGQVESGKETIAACDRAGLDIRAAFWAFDEDTQTWRFTIAEGTVDFKGTRSVYQRLVTVLDGAQGTLRLREVFVVSPEDRLVRLVRMAVQTGGSDIGGISFSGNVINGSLIPDMYIYRMYAPPLAAAGP